MHTARDSMARRVFVMEYARGCARWDVVIYGYFIDGILRGAAEGTFESLGIRVDVEVELFDRFNGRHTLRW